MATTLETSFSASASPLSPRPELPGNRRTPISAIAVTAAVLLAIPATVSAHDFNTDCNALAGIEARHEGASVHGDLNQAFGWAGSVMYMVDTMVAFGEGTRDSVLRQCAGVETPQFYWEQLKREADRYVPVPTPAPQPAPAQSILCDPVLPGMPIVCRPFPVR
jgi:hypothetical protein